MRLFEINFDRLTRRLSPVKLRGPRLLGLTGAMVAPIKSLYERFIDFRTDVQYRLDHSSQVCHMRAVLNDTFDPTYRRLNIVDGPDFNPLYVFRKDESKPRYLRRTSENAPLHLYTEPETYLGDDFVVTAPIGLVFDQTRMRAMIDEYRLVSKKDYSITAI